MKPADLLQLLGEFYREKGALWRRHLAVSRIAGQYDLNNTYQYVIGREEDHRIWIRQALVSMDGDVPPDVEPEAMTAATGDAGVRAVVADDAARLDACVAAWQPRIAAVTQARHKRMLELILGEMAEQARLFRQAAGGDLDVIGRRTGGARTDGVVLSSRWVG